MKRTLVRQSFLGADSDTLLDELSVAIVGLGGGGSHIVQQLSHLGVGALQLIDPDRAEWSNLNRLVGATAEDVVNRRFKADIAARQAKSVNPIARIAAYTVSWGEVLEVLRSADIIFGCLDTYASRDELESFARRYLIPYIDIGMDVHRVGDHYVISGQIARSMPGDLCLKCMGIITKDQIESEAYGVAGGRPQVVWPNGALASFAVGLAIELVTPWFRSNRQSEYLSYDGNTPWLKRHPWMETAHPRSCKHYPPEDVGDPHAFWLADQDVAAPTRGTRFSKLLGACKNLIVRLIAV